MPTTTTFSHPPALSGNTVAGSSAAGRACPARCAGPLALTARINFHRAAEVGNSCNTSHI